MSEQAQMAAAAVAFAILLFFGGLVFWLRRAHEIGRLRRFVAAHTQGADPSAPVTRVPDTSAIAVGLNQRISQSGLARRLDLQLIRAGLSITANQFILGQVALGTVLFLAGRYVLFAEQGSPALLYAIAMAAPAVVLPRLALKLLERRRVGRFEAQLAQTVDIMAGALQAGTSLPQSFVLVHREMPVPISEEFGRLIQECTLGIPLEQALRNMLERVPSTDLEMLVSAINIQYRVGGNLTHILKTIAHTIRERVRIRGEINTLTAQARMSGYVISGMPVFVVVALMFISPAYIMKLFDPGITRFMLIGGIVGIISGFYVMKRIAMIEV